MVRHQVVPPEGLVDRGHRRRVDPGAGKLGGDASGSPPRVVRAHPADLPLELGLDLRRGARGPPGAVREPSGPLGEVAPAVPVVGLSGDPVSPAHRCHRLAGPLGLKEHLESQFGHAHHPQGHPASSQGPLEERVGPHSGGVTHVSGTSHICPERSVSCVSGTHMASRARLVNTLTPSSCGFVVKVLTTHGRARPSHHARLSVARDITRTT